MATRQKTFNFTADEEGWIAYPANANIFMAWLKPRTTYTYAAGDKSANDPIKTLGGCLRTTASRNNDEVDATSYWELTCNWEALGVPGGGVVTEVNLGYCYKWDLGVTGGGTARSNAVISAGSTASGRAIILDNADTEIGEFSGEVPCIPRSGPSDWNAYPRGYTSDTVLNGYGRPNGWGWAEGTPVSVPSELQASDSTIKFRIHSRMPHTNAADKSFVRLKQDFVQITVTYVGVEPNTSYMVYESGTLNFYVNGALVGAAE